MFFHLNTGVISNVGENPCCWKADDFLFIDRNGCLISFPIYVFDKDFCDFLDVSISHSNFTSIESASIYIALEEEDDGHRNLCLYDKYIQVIIDLDTNIISALSNFLRNYK